MESDLGWLIRGKDDNAVYGIAIAQIYVGDDTLRRGIEENNALRPHALEHVSEAERIVDSFISRTIEFGPPLVDRNWPCFGHLSCAAFVER
jgi:hypothetical protein